MAGNFGYQSPWETPQVPSVSNNNWGSPNIPNPNQTGLTGPIPQVSTPQQSGGMKFLGMNRAPLAGGMAQSQRPTGPGWGPGFGTAMPTMPGLSPYTQQPQQTSLMSILSGFNRAPMGQTASARGPAPSIPPVNWSSFGAPTLLGEGTQRFGALTPQQSTGMQRLGMNRAPMANTSNMGLYSPYNTAGAGQNLSLMQILQQMQRGY